ncbi:MAG: hypothetical protein CMN04_07600 [Roseibacillus sp.]|nr:hypothetical protein [Roseibacillus sp.]
MRGNPTLQIGVLTLAMALMAALVTYVLRDAGETGSAVMDSRDFSEFTTVSTLLSITLSAPATSLSLTEPSGRIIQISPGADLEMEQEVELTLRDAAWSALLSVTWQDPSHRQFLRLDFEPDNLKSAHVLLDFRGNTERYPITADFDTRAQ